MSLHSFKSCEFKVRDPSNDLTTYPDTLHPEETHFTEQDERTYSVSQPHSPKASKKTDEPKDF